jgi:hypothetical protein
MIPGRRVPLKEDTVLAIRRAASSPAPSQSGQAARHPAAIARGVLFAFTNTFLPGQTLHIDSDEPLT